MCGPVGARAASHALAEELGEVVRIVHADGTGHVADPAIFVQQQVLGVFDAHADDVFDRRDLEVAAPERGKMRNRQMHGVCEIRQSNRLLGRPFQPLSQLEERGRDLRGGYWVWRQQAGEVAQRILQEVPDDDRIGARADDFRIEGVQLCHPAPGRGVSEKVIRGQSGRA